MDPIADDFSPAALTAICEANLRTYILHCTGNPTGARHETAGLTWGCSGIDLYFLNSVVQTHFTDASALANAIAETVAAFRQRGLPFLWWVMPSTEPTDLATHLRTQGFIHYRDLPAMTVDLAALSENFATPPGTSIGRVLDASALGDWTEVLALTQNWSAERSTLFYTLHEQLGVLEENQPYQIYLARLNGIPVATSALFLGSGVAGIYWVATRPEAQRQGLGAAVTLAALHEARTLGYRIGILQATDLGYPVYQRLNFSEQCRMGRYLWEPQN